MTLPEGSVLDVEIPDTPCRLGKVRWVKGGGSGGTLHGVEFETPAEEPAVAAHRRVPARHGRRLPRRVFVGLVTLAMLALAAYGFMWLIGEFRAYRP